MATICSMPGCQTTAGCKCDKAPLPSTHIEPTIGWPAHCASIMTKLSEMEVRAISAEQEVERLQLEVAGLSLALELGQTPPPQTQTMDDIHREQLDRPRLKPASPQTNVRGTPELYAARICKSIPADCCDYGIIALAEGVEVCRVWTEENARKIARLLNRDSHARQSKMDGNRPLPYDRETLGRFVREAWVRWAETQPNPKPSWLVPYDELSEPDKEADRQIGEALARWTLIGDAARASFSPPPQTREVGHD